MPETTTSGEQILEAVVAGPDGANRLFTVTGAANVQILASGDPDPVNPTWTFPMNLKGSKCALNSFLVRAAPL